MRDGTSKQTATASNAGAAAMTEVDLPLEKLVWRGAREIIQPNARGSAALPWLYLKGVSSSDLGEALEVLVGDGAKGLSLAALGRLKAQWSEEYPGWSRCSLAESEYAY